MPYIPQVHREAAKTTPLNPGELNYAITMLLQTYLKGHATLSYQAINDCLGALEGAKLEFVRRVVNPYEDRKIASAGDVYPTT